MQTLVISELGLNQNYNTFALMLLIKFVLCGESPWTKLIDYKCCEMKFRADAAVQRACTCISCGAHTSESEPDADSRVDLPGLFPTVFNLIRMSLYDKYSGLLRTWIISVLGKYHLVRIGRIDGPTEYLSYIPQLNRTFS
jgi:hypothetical protein